MMITCNPCSTAHRVEAVQQLAIGAAPEAQAAVLAATGQQFACLRPAERVDCARVACQAGGLLQAAGKARITQRCSLKAVWAVAKGGGTLKRGGPALPLEQGPLHARFCAGGLRSAGAV